MKNDHKNTWGADHGSKGNYSSDEGPDFGTPTSYTGGGCDGCGAFGDDCYPYGKPNDSIECTVRDCTYHCGDCDYCSLAKIKVATNKHGDPKTTAYTDCNSYHPKTTF